MGRTIAAIVSGIVVGLLTGVPAYFFLLAATWSGIHGGMSEMTLAVLSLVALAVPPGCGFLAGRAVYRRRATQMTDSIHLKCPHCGCYLKPSAEYSATPQFIFIDVPD